MSKIVFNDKVTWNRLNELLYFDEKIGEFFWIKTTNSKTKVGDMAGTWSKKGYIKIAIDGVLYPAHRLVWLYLYRELPKIQIDHENEIKSDNRPTNLRLATNHLNQCYAHSSNLLCGIRSTYYKWEAHITFKGKQRIIGYFDTLKEAIIAYNKAARKFMEMERTNII